MERAVGGGMTCCVYYVVAGIGNGEPICATGRLRSQLCESITRAARNNREIRLRVQILAFCVDELWVRALLEVANAREVGRFLRLVSDEYAARRSYELGAGCAATFFRTIRCVRLNTTEDQLLAVRHCHLAPVHLGLVERPEDWRWSTHRSYLGVDHTPELRRSTITYLLAGGAGGWPLAYRYLVGEPEPGESMLKLPILDVVILPNAEPDGDRACLKVLSAHPRERERERIFKAVVVEVCDSTGCDPHEFMADPSNRRFRLERALLLEEFTVRRRRIINVHQLAIRLHSDRSWLYRTRAECRLQHPEFFAKRNDSAEHHTLSASNANEQATRAISHGPGAWWQWSVPVAAIAYQALGFSVQVDVPCAGCIDISALLTGSGDAPFTASVPEQRPESAHGSSDVHAMATARDGARIGETTQEPDQPRESGESVPDTGNPSARAVREVADESPVPGTAKRSGNRSATGGAGGWEYPLARRLNVRKGQTPVRELRMERDDDEQEATHFRRR